MIMFYDVMLIDDDPVLHRPHGERRRLLLKLVKRIEGRSDCTYHARVRFSKPEGLDNLRKSLALAFVRRWEGLVLKPYDEPYFDLIQPVKGRYPSCWIKLKKDCIKGLGDTADFAVIGGGYDAGRAARLNLPNIRWTHFYTACLRNKANVLLSGAKPDFLVFDEISDCIGRTDMKTLNELGRIREMKPGSCEALDLFNIEQAQGLSMMTTMFRCPFLFDIAGSGFDKSPNRNVFTLRFPRVMKVHWDRDWKEAVGLDELQHMAEVANTTHSDETSDPFHDEIRSWVEKLKKLDRGAHGQLTAWDVSDNDNEDDNIALSAKGPPAKTSVKTSRRSRASAAPPFIRMDTAEMRNGEWRLSNGDVGERPTSKHSMVSITSDGSLQTPPTSSPFANPGKTNTRQNSTTESDGCVHNGKRRRSADTDMEKTSTRLKKARPMFMQQSETEPQTIHSSIATTSKPLREITDNARPSLQPQFQEASPQTKAPMSTDFPLLRKLPLDTVQLCPQKSKKVKITRESSPGRETTATQSTIAPTTQGTTEHITEATYSPIRKTRTKPKCNSLSLPTPPCTADSAMVIVFPALHKSKIVLSPDLIHEKRPIGPVRELLKSLSINPSSFRQALCRPESPEMIASVAGGAVQIIVLVEPQSTIATRKAMVDLLKNVQAWHPISLAFWDWRVLEIERNRDGAKGSDHLVTAEDQFYAKMTWNPQWESQGAVEVEWRDGSMDRVLREDLGMPKYLIIL